MQDSTLALADGRTLAYTDLGAPDGPLVVYFHGAPSSRLDLATSDAELAARGVRVVSPDRPGYGRSSPQPGRRREQWPADVAALADALGHDRFAVCGLSSGGPYTVVCAALLADRVAAATVVAGMADVAWGGFFDTYADDWPALVELMRCPDDDAAQARCDELFGVDGTGFAAQVPRLGAGDRAWFRAGGDDVAAFRATSQEALRQGTAGFVQDIRIEGQPWAFDPTAITAPVRVLHGETDILLPIAHSRHTAATIPGATFEIVPGHGHLSILGTFPDIAAQLAVHIGDR